MVKSPSIGVLLLSKTGNLISVFHFVRRRSSYSLAVGQFLRTDYVRGVHECCHHNFLLVPSPSQKSWIPKYKDQNQNFRPLKSYKCTDPETEMSFSEASVVWLSLLSHLESLSRRVNTIQTRSVDPMIVDDQGVFHVS